MTYDSGHFSMQHDSHYVNDICDAHFSASSTDEQPTDSAEVTALRQQADRLSHLLQVMPAGVIVIDGYGIVRQANSQAIDLLGEPLEGELWRTIIARSFKPRADDGHEVSLIDGRRVKLSITPLQNEPGQLIVLTDLTETRQLQARVSHMQRLSALGKMVASLAHQIRTPLSAAMLYAANLTRSDLGQEATSGFAHKLTARLQELESQVNDMLLFAKSGEDQVVSNLTLTDLKMAIAPNAVTLADQAQLSVVFEGFEQDAAMVGNLTALQGAVLNLIHNACQVSEPGAQVTVRATVDNESLSLEVADCGPGVTDSVKDKIFEPFFTTKTHGTGLGLAVVKSVVNAHKGQLTVANNATAGAVFTMTFPAHATQRAVPTTHSDGELV